MAPVRRPDTTHDASYNRANCGWRFGCRFRPGFSTKLLRQQAGHGRRAYNHPPETFWPEYEKRGCANCTRGHIWHTERRSQTLCQTVPHVPPDKLSGLCPRYGRYAETERLKAEGEKAEFAGPHFRRYGDPVSIPPTVWHDWTAGSAIMRAIHTSGLGGLRLRGSFPVLNHGPGKAAPCQAADMKRRIRPCIVKPACDEPGAEPAVVGPYSNTGNTAALHMVVMPPECAAKRPDNPNRTMRRAQCSGPGLHDMFARKREDGLSVGDDHTESSQRMEPRFRNGVLYPARDMARREGLPRAYTKDADYAAPAFTTPGKHCP